jgi:hypothetical protein
MSATFAHRRRKGKMQVCENSLYCIIAYSIYLGSNTIVFGFVRLTILERVTKCLFFD